MACNEKKQSEEEEEKTQSQKRRQRSIIIICIECANGCDLCNKQWIINKIYLYFENF